MVHDDNDACQSCKKLTTSVTPVCANTMLKRFFYLFVLDANGAHFYIILWLGMEVVRAQIGHD